MDCDTGGLPDDVAATPLGTDTSEIPLVLGDTRTDKIRLSQGWHGLEIVQAEPYRWTAPDFEIDIDEMAECLVVEYARPDDFGLADCRVDGAKDWAEAPVRAGRSHLIIDLDAVMATPGKLRFSLSKTGRAEGDAREFGLCVFSGSSS